MRCDSRSDLVNRRFGAVRPDELHVADFTYVPMISGFGYTWCRTGMALPATPCRGLPDGPLHERRFLGQGSTPSRR